MPVYNEPQSNITHQERSTPNARSFQVPPPVPAHGGIAPQQSAVTHAHESSYPLTSAVAPPVPVHRTLDDSSRSSTARKPIRNEGMASGQGVGAYSNGPAVTEASIAADPTSAAHKRSYDRAMDLDKELPVDPAVRTEARNRDFHTARQTASVGAARATPKQRTIGEQPYIVEGATEPPSLKGIVDLTDTVDTTITERYAPGKRSPTSLYV